MPRSLPLLLLAVGLAAGAAQAGPGPLPPQPAGDPFPTDAWSEAEAPAGTDLSALDAAATRLFSFHGRNGLPDTRALLVAQGGRIVFERYADGFDRSSRFRSFSAGKSVMQALVARLVFEGRLDIDAPAPVPEWQGADDPRHAITIRNLLNMDSGLDNADGSGTDANSFAARLLFGHESRDSAGFAARVQLVHPPGSHWAYSTGTTQILSRIVAREAGGGRAGMIAFARDTLAAPLGIHSLVYEFDAVGTPLGGAYAWMTARDWARLGLLYLRDGVWDGQRLFPEGWVRFTRTPGGAPNNGVYGAHFWVTGTPGPGQWSNLGADLDAFQMNGNGGQVVAMLPRRDLLIVRLGETAEIDWPELNEALSQIARAFPLVWP